MGVESRYRQVICPMESDPLITRGMRLSEVEIQACMVSALPEEREVKEKEI